MKQVIFTAILICALCFATFAQDESKSNVPIADPDVFGKMTWKEEKLRLDNFSKLLNQNVNKIGFIVIDFGNNINESKKSSRLERIASYLVKTKKIRLC